MSEYISYSIFIILIQDQKSEFLRFLYRGAGQPIFSRNHHYKINVFICYKVFDYLSRYREQLSLYV